MSDDVRDMLIELVLLGVDSVAPAFRCLRTVPDTGMVYGYDGAQQLQIVHGAS